MPLPIGATAFQTATDPNSYVIPASATDPNSYWLKRAGNDLAVQLFGQPNSSTRENYFPENPDGIDFRAEPQLVFPRSEAALGSSLTPPDQDQQKFNSQITRVGPALVAAWVSQYSGDGNSYRDRFLISRRGETPYSGNFSVFADSEIDPLGDGPQLCALASSSFALHSRNVTRIMDLRGQQHGGFGQFSSATTQSIFACLNDPQQLFAIATAHNPDITIFAGAGTLVARINLPLPFSRLVGIYPLKDGGFVAASASPENELRLQIYSATDFTPTGDTLVIPNAENPRMANSKASWSLVSWTAPESGHIQALSFNNQGVFGRQLDLGLNFCNSSLGVLPDGNILCVNILPGDHPLFRVVNGFTGIPQNLVQNLIFPPAGKPQLGTATEITFNTQKDGEVNIAWISGQPRPRQGIALNSLPALASHMSIVVPSDEARIAGGFGADQIFTNGYETVRTQGGQDIIFIPRAPNATVSIEDFNPSQQRINLFPFAEISTVRDLVIRQERASTRVELPDNQSLILQGASGITRANFVFSSPREELLALAEPRASNPGLNETNSGQNSSGTSVSGGLFSTANSASASATASASGLDTSASATASNSGSATSLSGISGIFGHATGSSGPNQNQVSDSSASFATNPFIMGGAAGALGVFLMYLICCCVRRHKKEASHRLANAV